MKSNRMLAIAVLIAASPWSLAAEHLVSQKDKSFSVKTLDIKVGDKVAFRNDDAFSHNIFSLTDAMPFDLGTYSGGQMKAVTFAKPGKFEIECAIHPDMHMVINVAP
jgi:plastocyanin